MTRKRSRKRVEIKVTVDEVIEFSKLLSDFVYEHKASIPVAIGGMQFLQEFMIADMDIPQSEIDKMRRDIRVLTREALNHALHEGVIN